MSCLFVWLLTDIFSADCISTTIALPSHCSPAKATNQYLWSSTSELCEGDAPATFTSILFVHTWHVTDSPVPQQMGPLCTGELLTNSRLNECESADATIATTVECCHCALRAKARRGALSESICSASSRPRISKGLRDRWSPYRFPHSVFLQTTLSLASVGSFLFFLLRQSFFPHLSPSTCTLPVSFLSSPHFTSFLSLAVSIFQTWHVRILAARLRVSEKGGEIKALSDPLCFHFPGFLRGTDSIAACRWGWQWHLKVPLPLDACLLCFSRIRIPQPTAAASL